MMYFQSHEGASWGGWGAARAVASRSAGRVAGWKRIEFTVGARLAALRRMSTEIGGFSGTKSEGHVGCMCFASSEMEIGRAHV